MFSTLSFIYEDYFKIHIKHIEVKVLQTQIEGVWEQGAEVNIQT